MEHKRYGLPFKGYMSSVPAHMVPDDYLASGVNLDYVARDGSWKARRGSFQKTSAMLEQSGATIQPRRVFAFQSPSTTDSAEIFGVMYGGSFGCFAFRHNGTAASASADNCVIGDDYSATQYPADFVCIPLLANGAYTRLTTAAQRAVVASGSWNCLEVGGWIHFPSYDGIPHKWNKRFNGSTTLGSEDFMVYPAGNIPPLVPPQIDSATSWTLGDGPWEGGKWFYVSQVFEYEDGSYSQPYIPRPVTGTLTSGLGLIQVPGVPGTKYRSVSLHLFPGPPMVRRVHVLATPMADSPDELNIRDGLQVWFSVDHTPDNVYTADTTGFPTGEITDFALTVDTKVVSFKRIWMPPSRFMWTGDQRVWAGHGNVYRGGIILAQKFACEATASGPERYAVVEASQLRLYGDAFGDLDTISLTSTKTLQDLCDEINTIQDTADSMYYVAQLVPGTDPTLPSTYLMNTGTTDFGDGSITGDTAAAFRGNAAPLVLWLSSDALTSVSATKRRVYFTEGGPGIGGLSGASWIAGNYREMPDSIGNFMAGGNTLYGQLVACQKGVAVIRNTRDGRTGFDEDYYVHVINERRGCISTDSFVQGDGWVGYLTEDGFVCCDGNREIIISEAVYSPATREGDWAYEIEQCKNSTRGDDDAAYFRAAVIEGVIYVSFRGSDAQIPDRLMKYDFSGSASGNGLEELLRSDGTPWGWCVQHDFEYDTTGIGIGAIGVIRASDGPHIYAASDSTTTNGRVEEIESPITNADSNATHSITCTTNTDPGTSNFMSTSDTFARVIAGAGVSSANHAANTSVLNVNSATSITTDIAATGAGSVVVTFTGRTVESYGYTKLQLGDISRRKSLRRVTFVYKKGESVAYLDGLVGLISRDNNRSTETEVLLPETDASAAMSLRTVTPKVRLMAPAKEHEFGYRFDGMDLDVYFPQFWGIEADFETLDSNK